MRIPVLAIGGALLSAASLDPHLADRIQEACLRHIRGILDAPTND